MNHVIATVRLYYARLRKGRLIGHGMGRFIYVAGKGWEKRELFLVTDFLGMTDGAKLLMFYRVLIPLIFYYPFLLLFCSFFSFSTYFNVASYGAFRFPEIVGESYFEAVVDWC